MIDYLTAIATESNRFGRLIRNTSPEAPVPSCPDWSVADLAWHLLEVQHFWGSIVANLLESPDSVVPIERPGDSELADLFDEQTERLTRELRSKDPNAVCWSWHAAGHRVGWVLRRQAHEALIHRVDAELAHGKPLTVDDELAEDGIDEALRVMIDASDLPDWSRFDPDGSTARIESGALSWAMRLGRFIGVSPNTGNSYDDPALQLSAPTEAPDTIIRGSGTDLDLWIWGRGSADPLEIEGDTAIVTLIREAAALGTQ